MDTAQPQPGDGENPLRLEYLETIKSGAVSVEPLAPNLCAMKRE